MATHWKAVCLLIIAILSFSVEAVKRFTDADAFYAWRQAYGIQEDSPEAMERFREASERIARFNEEHRGLEYEAELNDDVPPSVVSRKRQAGPSPPIEYVNQFSHLSYEQFVRTYTGMDTSLAEPVVVAAVTGLSAAAVAGIVVAAVVVAGAAGGAGAAVYIKKRRSGMQPVAEEDSPEVQPRKKGVDVFNMDPMNITSISARAPPQKLEN